MKPGAPFLILAVVPAAEDRLLLRQILSSAIFDLCLAETFEQASSLIQRKGFDLIVTERFLSEKYSWKHVLQSAHQSRNTPVIVCDRLADERLWAEVLNMGGYDVLMKPLNPTEVLRVVAQCLFQAEGTFQVYGKSATAAAS